MQKMRSLIKIFFEFVFKKPIHFLIRVFPEVIWLPQLRKDKPFCVAYIIIGLFIAASLLWKEGVHNDEKILWTSFWRFIAIFLLVIVQRSIRSISELYARWQKKSDRIPYERGFLFKVFHHFSKALKSTSLMLVGTLFCLFLINFRQISLFYAPCVLIPVLMLFLVAAWSCLIMAEGAMIYEQSLTLPAQEKQE